jgi:hypothetical protein
MGFVKKCLRLDKPRCYYFAIVDPELGLRMQVKFEYSDVIATVIRADTYLPRQREFAGRDLEAEFL